MAPPTPPVSVPPSTARAVVLGAVAGYVDTAGFLALLQIFTAHVTGNLVLAGAAIANERTDNVMVRLALLPVFGLAVVLAVVVDRRARARGRASLLPLLVVETAWLAAFTVLGKALEDRLLTESWALFVVGAAGVAAMGVQNALARLAIAGPPTTVMTGNVTQLAIDLVDTLAPTGDVAHREQARGRLGQHGGLIAGFVVGAAAGALLVEKVGLACIVVPTVITALLAAIEWWRMGR
jgi:uncharacterized membrane protein YoaK (UPF0700 family)